MITVGRGQTRVVADLQINGGVIVLSGGATSMSRSGGNYQRDVCLVVEVQCCAMRGNDQLYQKCK